MKTYEERVAEFKHYMKGVANDCKHQSKLYDFDDLYQEISMVLYKCWQKYSDKPDYEFTAIFKSSLCRMLASLFRRRRAKDVNKDEIVQTTEKMKQPRIRKSANTRGLGLKGIIPEIGYNIQIEDLIEAVDTASQKTIKFLISTNSKGRTTCPGYEHALHEAKKNLRCE